ncbi:hypothetical protein [uncultured Amaricoccus sp.]|nr:hypothetical protein [uncultured Amaricoccus sp.]
MLEGLCGRGVLVTGASVGTAAVAFASRATAPDRSSFSPRT